MGKGYTCKMKKMQIISSPCVWSNEYLYTYRARALVEAGLYYHWMQQEMPATNCRYAPSIITVQEPLSLGNLWVSVFCQDTPDP